MHIKPRAAAFVFRFFLRLAWSISVTKEVGLPQAEKYINT